MSKTYYGALIVQSNIISGLYKICVFDAQFVIPFSRNKHKTETLGLLKSSNKKILNVVVLIRILHMIYIHPKTKE